MLTSNVKFYYDEKNEKYYHIPKNSFIFGNIHSMVHNKQKYISSDTFADKKDYMCGFNINNWLIKDDNNDEMKFIDKGLPIFGSGLRSCVGQTLAKNELYLVLGMFILNYQFLPPNGIKPEDFIVPLTLPQYFEMKNNNQIGVVCKKRVNVPHTITN